jgi:hypothetical protein
MAREVVISQPGAGEVRAKVRNPFGVLGLTLITLGIYGWFWWYQINWEMSELGKAKGRDDLGDSPMQSALAYSIGSFILIPWIVTLVRTVKRAQRAQAAAGVESFSGRLFAVIFIFTLGIAGNPYLQAQLNKAWTTAGTPATAA